MFWRVKKYYFLLRFLASKFVKKWFGKILNLQVSATEKIYQHPSLNGLRTVLRQLVLPLYTSKDAPRPPFSNARRFISFGQLLMPLRAHLWTVALRKIHKIREYASFFEKNIQNLVTLIRCRRVINQLVLPL